MSVIKTRGCVMVISNFMLSSVESVNHIWKKHYAMVTVQEPLTHKKPKRVRIWRGFDPDNGWFFCGTDEAVPKSDIDKLTSCYANQRGMLFEDCLYIR